MTWKYDLVLSVIPSVILYQCQNFKIHDRNNVLLPSLISFIFSWLIYVRIIKETIQYCLKKIIRTHLDFIFLHLKREFSYSLPDHFKTICRLGQHSFILLTNLKSRKVCLHLVVCQLLGYFTLPAFELSFQIERQKQTFFYDFNPNFLF